MAVLLYVQENGYKSVLRDVGSPGGGTYGGTHEVTELITAEVFGWHGYCL